MQACGLTLESLIASSSSGLYCTMRPGSSPQLAEKISFGLASSIRVASSLAAKPPNTTRVHRADPRAGQHRDHGFRHHRHIEDDAVALDDAEILHDGGKRLHLMQHLGIGQPGDDAARQRRIVDQRQLVGAAARDMAVERVVAGVDHGAGEPAAVQSHRRIEDLFRRARSSRSRAPPRPKSPRDRPANGHGPRDTGCSGCSWRRSRSTGC